jgi:phage tail-like protein
MADKLYPLPSFCFKVTIDVLGNDAPTVSYFRSVSGLRSETEILPVKEGGVNHTTWQLSNGVKWSNIVLKRGFTGSDEMIKWRESWALGGRVQHVRHDGTITQLNSKMEAAASWSFVGGMPVKWEVSDFDASKSELSIETLEIAHHGLVFLGRK